ncbi:gag-pol polyprotein [Gossypium australe]|uniref:Gag-pol polyprotein n=1 Tax=Gossypium australe TaxID=47621 RepID=A0A5B6W0B2_9ROSI|nr:gag-pol polyprotein [Gossypium australe]
MVDIKTIVSEMVKVMSKNTKHKLNQLKDDAQLFLQIQNFIDCDVVALINHYEFVKELMNHLEFLYFGKGNISWMYEVCQAFNLLKIKTCHLQHTL